MFGSFKKKSVPAPRDASCIVPRIKHTDFLTAIGEMGLEQADTPLTEPLVADLIISYAFDLPEAFEMMTHGDLAALGLTIPQVREAAIANLRAQLNEVNSEGEPPVLMLVTGDQLEACLLLLDDVWESIGESVPGELVVAVPNREVLFMTSSQSTEGLQGVQEAIVEVQQEESPHHLSRQLLIRRNGRWEVFEQAA